MLGVLPEIPGSSADAAGGRAQHSEEVHNLSSDNTAVKTALKEVQEQQQADAKGKEEATAALVAFREEAAAREAKAAGECERMFKLVQQAHEKVRPPPVAAQNRYYNAFPWFLCEPLRIVKHQADSLRIPWRPDTPASLPAAHETNAAQSVPCEGSRTSSSQSVSLLFLIK